MIQKTFMKWYWMPAVVFLLGVISLFLIVWTDEIHEKQRVNYLRVGAIMDVQIHTSKYHLWFEEALAGDPTIDMTTVWTDHERAEKILSSVLNGGATEHGLIEAPLKDLGLRKQAEEILSELVSFGAIARQRMLSPATSGIGSAADQKFDDIFGGILKKAALLESDVEAESVKFQSQSKNILLGVVLVWASIVIVVTLGMFNREQRRKTSDNALRSAHATLLSQAEELKAHREQLEGIVSIRTSELTAVNKSLEEEIVGHMQTEEALKKSEKQLRYLSSMLLTSQEDERKRISRELHDGLGQALTVMKLRLRAHKRQLTEYPGPLRDDCDDMLSYIQTLMDDVRRISRDLCPSILEDMGLTSALRWLVQEFENSHDIRLSRDLADLDGLFAKNEQTSIYRIMQEALNNSAKHAGAMNVSVIVRRFKDRADFFIEDDGKGFDVGEATARNESDKGLGLASMQERVNILGGVLDLSSDRGKGTRISFSVPMKEEHERISTLAG